MKTIQQRLFLLTALSGLSLLVFIILFMKNAQFYIISGSLFVIFSFSTSVLLLVFSIMEYKKLSFAKLIIENNILHIQAVESEQKSQKNGVVAIYKEVMEIFISCFGILFGSKIIKFNTEGIQLKNVEIGPNLINIYYGKGEKEAFIRLLHKTIEEEELENIMEQFRRETGIIPDLIFERGE